jgi:hypothetical protein
MRKTRTILVHLTPEEARATERALLEYLKERLGRERDQAFNAMVKTVAALEAAGYGTTGTP